MNFPWYAIFATVLAGLLILAVLSTIIIYLLRKNIRTSYKKLQTEESEKEFHDKEKLQQSRTISEFEAPSQEKGHISILKENYAESCYSDIESKTDSRSASAYGDGLQRPSVTSTDLQGRAPVRIQVSLILNKDKKYLAGKITGIKDMALPEEDGPNQVKIHMVLLPSRKYILKTKYKSIAGDAKLDEYFKLSFKTLPHIESCKIRYRVYCRRTRFGAISKEKCLGETFIDLETVAKSLGGITVWKDIGPKQVSP